MINRYDISSGGILDDGDVFLHIEGVKEYRNPNGKYCKWEDVEKLIGKLKCCDNCSSAKDYFKGCTCDICIEYDEWSMNKNRRQ